MADPTKDLLPEGLEDRLPQSAAAATRIERAVLDALLAHGYDRVRPPLIEFERSLAQRLSGRMDGTNSRHMFRFVDPKSLRTLALRSDMTVQVGRMAATSMADHQRPLRLCYTGQVAKIAGDALEPRRENLQLGAELIGTDTVAAAGEIVELAIAALEAAGATGISVDFTLPDLVNTLANGPFALDPAQRDSVRRELDMKDAGGLVDAGGTAYLPLLYATGPFADAVERLAALDAAGALDSRIDGLRQIAKRIEGRARLTLDPTERHGFEYQSWFGFTIYAAGVRSALGRGGTYVIGGSGGSGKSSKAGKSGEVATGFSLYPDELVEAVKSAEVLAAKLFLPIGHDRAAAAQLRSEGWRTLAALSDADDGAKLGCSHVLAGDVAKPL